MPLNYTFIHKFKKNKAMNDRNVLKLPKKKREKTKYGQK